MKTGNVSERQTTITKTGLLASELVVIVIYKHKACICCTLSRSRLTIKKIVIKFLFNCQCAKCVKRKGP